ncbi:MAG: hypothetical protein RQM92_15030 [Candidatus Syntrophopropionicum ammoniitolerans]
MDSGVQTVTGLENCINLFDNLYSLNENQMPGFIEMLACNGGCLGVPVGLLKMTFMQKNKNCSIFMPTTNSIINQMPKKDLHCLPQI